MNTVSDDAHTTRPLFVEFAGVPAAGKTTTAARLQLHCTAMGLDAVLMREAAEEMPHRELRGQWQFNAWNLLQTLTRILEVTSRARKPDVVIFDRGLFDALCWFEWLRRRGAISEELFGRFCRLIDTEEWYRGADHVVVLQAAYRTSLERRGGREGFVVNEHVFPTLSAIYAEQVRRGTTSWQRKKVSSVDTDGLKPDEVLSQVMELVGIRRP